MSSPTPAQTFRRLELQVHRRLDGALAGEHPGVRLGSGSEAEELVRYQPGDDVRRIDWNVSARTAQPQVWRTRAEHSLETWVLLDQSASMAFGTATAEKGDVADQLSAAIGLLTDGPGNRLGVLTLGIHGLTWMPPVAGRIAARRALRVPTDRPREGVAPVSLAEALDALGRHRRPGVRVVVSDLLDPHGQIEGPFDWEVPLRRLTARHDVLVLEVVDPRELTLPDVGFVVLVDPESGRRREVATSDPRLRTRYEAAAAAQRSAVAAAARSCRATHVVLSTDRDWVGDLARTVRARRSPRTHRRSC